MRFRVCVEQIGIFCRRRFDSPHLSVCTLNMWATSFIERMSQNDNMFDSMILNRLPCWWRCRRICRTWADGRNITRLYGSLPAAIFQSKIHFYFFCRFFPIEFSSAYYISVYWFIDNGKWWMCVKTIYVHLYIQAFVFCTSMPTTAQLCNSIDPWARREAEPDFVARQMGINTNFPLIYGFDGVSFSFFLSFFAISTHESTRIVSVRDCVVCRPLLISFSFFLFLFGFPAMMYAECEWRIRVVVMALVRSV